MTTQGGAVSRAPRPSSLADVLDLILDKGLVIDAYVRVSVAGIEVLTIDARIVIASVDTYLHFAEAVNRLDLGQTETRGLPELFGGDSDHDEGESGGGDRSGDGRRQGAGAARDGGREEARTQGRRDGASDESDDGGADGEADDGDDQDGPGELGAGEDADADVGGGSDDDEEEQDDRDRGLVRRIAERGRWEDR
ncbi:MAG TPA: gas vesicle protein GvpJ [Acidimicrobiales bacterium]|nr:gas vesicle protein GvpJ [Acidimicrobiales bacterium]